MLAATDNQAMLGFALSPDGSRLAYGGPADGLFIGASDGSEGFTKLSELRVRCLRWNQTGLYACLPGTRARTVPDGSQNTVTRCTSQKAATPPIM
jgi:hypothetical protein